MGLLLVRHSDAVSAGGDVDDAGRWLSASGRDKARAVARVLREKDLAFSHFLTSPRVRAVQTAELFAEVLGFRGAVVTLPALSYTVPAQQGASALARFSGNVAAFGHMPTLAEIAQLLCTKPVSVALSTSEALWLESGRLQWAVGPQDIRESSA